MRRFTPFGYGTDLSFPRTRESRNRYARRLVQPGLQRSREQHSALTGALAKIAAMLAPTPPEERNDKPRRWDDRVYGVIPVVVVVVLLGAFAIGCAWLMITLIEHDKARYCLASGRHNCAPALE